MRARLDRSAALVGGLAAPENRLAMGVLADKLEPDVEGIYRSAWEEMSDLACAHHDVEPHRRSGRQNWRGAIERRRQLADFADHDGRILLGLFADREARHHLRSPAGTPHHWRAFRRFVDR